MESYFRIHSNDHRGIFSVHFHNKLPHKDYREKYWRINYLNSACFAFCSASFYPYGYIFSAFRKIGEEIRYIQETFNP